jgi:hypothetical protein
MKPKKLIKELRKRTHAGIFTDDQILARWTICDICGKPCLLKASLYQLAKESNNVSEFLTKVKRVQETNH